VDVPALSNKVLVQELKNGERLGCTHLVDLYQARLMGEAIGVFRLSTEDAEELVSDVLLAIIKSIHTFQFKRGDGDFTVWVVSVFRNRVRDFIRKQALTEGLTERFEEGNRDDSYSSVELEVMQTIVRRYEESIRLSETENAGKVANKLLTIADALDRLDAWERVLLRCRALDVSYEDIAKYAEKPVSQLKVYHARVKKKFVTILSETYPELLENEE
jgi:RNA polymerase sigma factor (sigma-70 family)